MNCPKVDNPTLSELSELIPEMVTSSIASNTLKRYAHGYRTWNAWCTKHPEADTLPVSSFQLILFIISIVQSKGSFGKIESVFYGLKWVHDALNLPSPFMSTTVKLIKEAAKRILAKPVRKKQPITPYMLRKLAKQSRNEIRNLRSLTLTILAYAGFLRFDEVSRLKWQDVFFEEDYFKLFIDHSKGDQHKVGEWVYIARTREKTCPYRILRRYIRTTKPKKGTFLFRGLVKKKTGYVLSANNKPISYNTARDIVMKAVESIGMDKRNFGTHSFRRGGASTAANAGINDRLFKKHGRWRSEAAKDGYVSECLEEKLSVTRSLGI